MGVDPQPVGLKPRPISILPNQPQTPIPKPLNSRTLNPNPKSPFRVGPKPSETLPSQRVQVEVALTKLETESSLARQILNLVSEWLHLIFVGIIQSPIKLKVYTFLSLWIQKLSEKKPVLPLHTSSRDRALQSTHSPDRIYSDSSRPTF